MLAARSNAQVTAKKNSPFERKREEKRFVMQRGTQVNSRGGLSVEEKR